MDPGIVSRRSTSPPEVHTIPGSVAAPAARINFEKNEEQGHVNDNARTYLANLEVVSKEGYVHPALLSMPLRHYARERLMEMSSYFKKIFPVINQGYDFRINTSGEEFLNTFLLDCKKDIHVKGLGNIYLSFKNFETVGSQTKIAHDVPYLKTFTADAISWILNIRNISFSAEDIKTHLKKIFTKSFEEELQRRQNPPFPDGDYRIYFTVEYPADAAEMILKAVKTLLIQQLAAKTPRMSQETRLFIIELLKKKYPHKPWDWVKIDHPEFEYIAVKYLAFSKLSLCISPSEQMLIVALGDDKGHRVEITLINRVRHKEISPSVSISSDHPEGENKVQCLMNQILGITNFLENTTDERSAKALICSYTKGILFPVKNGEDKEVLKTINAANDVSNRLVSKLILKGIKKENVLPYFLASLLEHNVYNHLFDNPYAAILCTLNTLELFKGHLKPEEQQLFVKLVKRLWSNITDKTHILYPIANILADQQGMVSERISFIKLCFYMYSHLSSNSHPQLQVHYRDNNGKKIIQAECVLEDASYTAVLDLISPYETAEKADHYLELIRDLPSLEHANSLLLSLWPYEELKARGYSPHKSHYPLKNIDLSSLTTCIKSSTKERVLLGTLLFFTYQSQTLQVLDPFLIAIALPKLISHYPLFQQQIFRSYSVINNEIVSSLQNLIGPPSSEQEVELILFDKIFSTLTAYSGTQEHAFIFWENLIQKNSNLTWVKKSDYTQHLVKKSGSFSVSMGLRTLAKVLKADLLSMEVESELFHALFSKWDSSGNTGSSDVTFIEVIYDQLKYHDILGLKPKKADIFLQTLLKIPKNLLTQTLEQKIGTLKEVVRNHSKVQRVQVVKHERTPIPPLPSVPIKPPEIKAKVKNEPQELIVQDSLRHEIENKIKGIEKIIEYNYSQATKPIEDLINIYKTLKQSEMVHVFRLVLNTAFMKSDLEFACVFINNEVIFHRLRRMPELYYEYINILLKNSLAHPHKIKPTNFKVLEKFLNEIDGDFFKDNAHVIFITDSLLALVANQIHYSFKIPANFITALIAKDYLFFKHFKNNADCIYACKWYKIFLHLNTTNRTEFTLLLIKLATKFLKNNTKVEPIYELIKDLARDYTKQNKAPLRSLLETVIHTTESLREAEECLCLIKEKQTLNQLEDFELIFNIIIKHKKNLKVSDVYKLLSHFSGHLKDPKAEWLRFYLDFLEECKNENQGLIGCQIVWSNCFDRHKSEIDREIRFLLHEYISFVFVQKTSLTEENLVMLCEMISQYYLTDFTLWKLALSSAKDRFYMGVIEKIGGIFEQHFTSIYISLLDERNKIIVIDIWYDLLLALKPTSSVTVVERLKNKDVLLDIGSTVLNKDQQCQVYQHIWSTFSLSIGQHPIKERSTLASELFHFCILWLDFTAYNMTEEKRLESLLLLLEMLETTKNEEDLTLFGQKFIHYLGKCSLTFDPTKGFTDLLKRVFEVMSKTKLKNSQLQSTLIDTLYKLVKDLRAASSLKIRILPLILIRVPTEDQIDFVVQCLDDLCDNRCPLTAEELKVLKNYQINEFLVFLTNDEKEYSIKNLLKLAKILKEDSLTLFADNVNVERLRVRVISHLLLANSTSLSENKLLLELCGKVSKVFAAVKLKGNDQQKAGLQEVYTTILLRYSLMTGDFTILESYIHLFAEMIHNLPSRLSNHFFRGMLMDFSKHFLSLKWELPPEQEKNLLPLIETINSGIHATCKKKGSEADGDNLSIRAWILSLLNSDKPLIKQSGVELCKKFSEYKNFLNLLSLQHFPILIEKSKSNELNPQFLESFCAHDIDEKKVALDLYLHICLASEYKMSINLESCLFNNLGFFFKIDTQLGISQSLNYIFADVHFNSKTTPYEQKQKRLFVEVFSCLKKVNIKFSDLMDFLVSINNANFRYLQDVLKLNIRTKIDLILSQIKLCETLLIKLENETPKNRTLYFNYLLRMFDQCYRFAVKACDECGVKPGDPLSPDSEPYNLIVENFSNLMEKYHGYIAECDIGIRKNALSEMIAYTQAYYKHRPDVPVQEKEYIQRLTRWCNEWLREDKRTFEECRKHLNTTLNMIRDMPRHKAYYNNFYLQLLVYLAKKP